MVEMINKCNDVTKACDPCDHFAFDLLTLLGAERSLQYLKHLNPSVSSTHSLDFATITGNLRLCKFISDQRQYKHLSSFVVPKFIAKLMGFPQIIDVIQGKKKKNLTPFTHPSVL